MPDRSPAQRRKSFEFVKAICAHEGLYPTPEVTARHERIIAGEITTEEGIALAIEAAKARAAASQAPAPGSPCPTIPPTDPAPSFTSVAQRRLNLRQAIACSRLEGFEPDAAFLADCEAYVSGTMTLDDIGRAATARALAAEAEADRLDAERAAGHGA